MALALVTLLGVEFLRPGTLPGGSHLPWAAVGNNCPSTRVEIVVAPEIGAAVETVLQPLNGEPLDGGTCLQVKVRRQSPVDTVASARAIAISQAPQLWVPDSIIWAAQIDQKKTWPLKPLGSLGTSPIVVAAGRATLTARGWDGGRATWTSVLTGAQPAAIPDLETFSVGQVLLASQWNALGKGSNGDRALVAAVLGVTRARPATLQDARQGARANSLEAPVVITTETALASAEQVDPGAGMVPVYPEGSAPVLDYPLVRIAAPQESAATAKAANAVAGALRGEAAKPVLRRAGLRDGAAKPVPGAPFSTTLVNILPLPDAPDLKVFEERLASLARPSRMLTVVDVSMSMKTNVPGTPLSRIALASQAAANAGTLLPGQASVGLWAFAKSLPDAQGRPWAELVPVAPLGAKEGIATHKEVVLAGIASLPSKLSGGGTALYRTTLDALRQMRRTYDPLAVNSVVLFTDGTNENDPTITLAQLLKSIKEDKAAFPDAPVTLVAIALGPNADIGVLKQIVAVNGGQAYQANTPQELQVVLYDAVARRPSANDPAAAAAG